MATADSTRGRGAPRGLKAPRDVVSPEGSKTPRSVVGALAAVAILALAAWLFWPRENTPPPPANASVPSDFGGTVSVAALTQLLNASPGGALNSIGLSLDIGRREGPAYFQVGDPLRVVVLAGEPARCALFHRNAASHFRLFHPQSGESFAVAPGENWESSPMRVTEQGPEAFLLVCRAAGAPEFDLSEVLQRPRAEWSTALSAVRADYLVRR